MYLSIPERVKKVQQISSNKGIELGFKFNSPANHHEIQQCEENLGFILPNSYKEFLKFSNGANVFCSNIARSEITLPWMADSGILIQSTSTIVAFNQAQDEIYIDDKSDKKYVAFAYLGYIGTGDFCSFDMTTVYSNSEYKVLDCNHDYSFEDWKADGTIANSFEDWLIKMFTEVIDNNRRPEYWIPSPLIN
jgi:hypothetical protein